MNKTLGDYIKYANDLHELFVKNGINMSINKLKNNINEIHKTIKNIQTIAKKLADVSNIANELILQRKRSLIKFDNNRQQNDNQQQNQQNNQQQNNQTNLSELNELNELRGLNDIPITIYPNNKDYIILLNKFSETKINIIDEKYNLNIPVKIVDNINDIPINYIYYIKNIKQFGYNVNGLTVTGNIGEIETNKTNLTICKFGIECKNINNNKKCNYYHDPNNIIDLYNKKIIDEQTKENLLSNNIFNFTNGGWIYNGNVFKNKTKNMRHIGGRSSINYDLEIIKNNIDLFQDEIEKRKAQSIHDIIILAYLLNNQYMSEYLYWD
jgi:hypothetical protein